VRVIQVQVPLKKRLKLMAVITLSIHIMTSQGRIYVLCVTNGIQQRNLRKFTKKDTTWYYWRKLVFMWWMWETFFLYFL